MQNGKIKTCSLASIFFFFQQIYLANCIFTKLMNNKIIRNSTRNHVQVHFENSCPFYINQMIVIEKDTYLYKYNKHHRLWGFWVFKKNF